jgi:YesN/AraC family two-component response regulator
MESGSISIDVLNRLDLESIINYYYINDFESGWTMAEAHSHNAMEVIYVINGTGYMRFLHDVVKLSKNNILVILSSKRHLFYVEKDSGCKLVDIQFNLNAIQSDNKKMSDVGKSFIVFKNDLFSDDGYLKLNDQLNLGECMTRIVVELEEKADDYKMLVKAEIIVLFIRLLRMIKDFVQKNDLTKNMYIHRAINYINNYLSEPLTPESVAKEVCISADYLMHLFKNITGCSIMEYINQTRMEQAKQLLIHTNIKVSDVSLDVGISNFQYFSTLFKKYTGISPSKFRKISHLKGYDENNTNVKVLL